MAVSSQRRGFFYFYIMESYIPIRNNEFIKLPNGSAIYNGHKYSRSSRAYLARAKSISTHTEIGWLEMLEFFNYLCCKCECEVVGSPCKDHIYPIYLGGTNSIKNIQPLCRNCNSSKTYDCTDYRIVYCQNNNLLMPEKWIDNG